MRLRIQVHRTEIIKRRLRGMGDNAMNAAPAFDRVADMMLGIMSKVFDSQGRRGGGSWRRLTTDWLSRKREAGLDPRILHATGDLRKSVTVRGANDQIIDISKDKLVFGSQLPYAERQHYGDDHIPARPYIDKFTENDLRRMKQVLAAHVVGHRASRRLSARIGRAT